MPNYSTDRELVPLSWLSQYGYCPRRCGLLAIEQQWSENEETVSGSFQHQRVHNSRTEHHGRDLFLYEIDVYSYDLGVNGKCDCIEAHYDDSGVYLPYGDGRYTLYPIEYKHGVVRQEVEYQIQLCAQAMCLEEQFGCTIPIGAIFYIDSHRRDEVILDEKLRQNTLNTAEKVLEMVDNQTVPMGHYSPKCKKCSLYEICQPKLKHKAASYCAMLWESIKLEKD